MSGRFRALACLIVPSLLTVNAIPAPAEAAASTIDYVAMGDSYSAGVGTPPTDACGHSPLGYPGLWAAANSPASYRNIACGGATTDDVLRTQLSALNPGTDLVSISIGGNDAGFFPTVSYCSTSSDKDCEQRVTDGRTAIAQSLPGKLDVTYAAIRQLAPTAKVIVLGYPRLFDPLADCPSDGMTTFRRQILNAAADQLARVIADRATAAGFVFVDVRGPFDGHAACTPTPWLNSLASTAVPLHPNAAGYAQGYLPAFRAAVTSAMPPTPVAFGALEQWTANSELGQQLPYNAIADVTGDKRADAIVVNNNGITVRRSTGTAFGALESWTTNAYYGQRLGAFADVTGDGRADAIVVNNAGITVRRSTGTAFSANESWTTDPYFGERLTAFADVTGDGRADAIAVNNGGITVRRSTGSGFSAAETWSTAAYFGERFTDFADVNGDGRADAIAVNNSGIFVRRSTGTGFSPSEAWSGSPYFGEVLTAFADVSGDGRADAIAINNGSITVRRSTGTNLSSVETWNDKAFFGNHWPSTLFADVTGDGCADVIAINDWTGYQVKRAS